MSIAEKLTQIAENEQRVYEAGCEKGRTESGANIVPLVVGNVGAYDATSPIIITETFTGGGEPDALLYGDTPMFKAKKLVATEDIFTLAFNEQLADKLFAAVGSDVLPICEFELFANLEGTYLMAKVDNTPVIIWVIQTDTVFMRQEDGFENNSVYVLDVWSLMGLTGEVSLTALGKPDKSADGFMPVEVAIPTQEELVITPDTAMHYINNRIYYKNIIVNPVPETELTIKPSVEEQKFFYGSNVSGYIPDTKDYKWFHRVRVEPIDLTQTSLLCDIEIDTLPKTEYVLGEWLETNGGIITRHYTNGITKKITMVNSYIYKFDELLNEEKTGIGKTGTHTLVVQYTENGITCRTTYDITVTE